MDGLRLIGNAFENELSVNVEDCEKHIASIGHFFFNLWLNQKFCDIQLIFADGGSALAHSIVLAFHSEKLREFAETHALPTRIHFDYQGSEAISELLHFVYTGKATFPVEKMPSLFRLAVYLEIRSLIPLLEEKIREMSKVSAQNCLLAVHAVFLEWTINWTQQETQSFLTTQFILHSKAWSAQDLRNLPSAFVKFMVSTKHLTTNEKINAINLALTWIFPEMHLSTNRMEVLIRNTQFAAFNDESNADFCRDLHKCLMKFGAQVFVARDEYQAVYLGKDDNQSLDLHPQSSQYRQLILPDNEEDVVTARDDETDSCCPSDFSYSSSQFELMVGEMRENTINLPDPFVEQIGEHTAALPTDIIEPTLEYLNDEGFSVETCVELSESQLSTCLLKTDALLEMAAIIKDHCAVGIPQTTISHYLLPNGLNFCEQESQYLF